MDDRSNGYEAKALEFHHDPSIGPDVVRAWTRSLAPGAAVLELGCGDGSPISQVLVDAGLELHAVDASPTLLARFRRRFPGVPTECAAVEDSALFGRTFDAALAWGLLFLLTPVTQARLIARVGDVVVPGGRFLFTAPAERCAWIDVLTGRESSSLGQDAYTRLLQAAGFELIGTSSDRGDNYYYSARRRPQVGASS